MLKAESSAKEAKSEEHTVNDIMVFSMLFIIARNLCESKRKRLLTLRARGCNATNNSGTTAFVCFTGGSRFSIALNILAFRAMVIDLRSKVNVPYNS